VFGPFILNTTMSSATTYFMDEDICRDALTTLGPIDSAACCHRRITARIGLPNTLSNP
jgi:hypothetical protein